MENIVVIIERNEDGSFTAVPQHNCKVGFIGMGTTVEMAIEDLQNSYKEARELLSTLPDMSFEYKFDAASFLNYMSGKLNLADLQTITGVNRHQLSHYATGKSRPSRKTIQRMQDGILRFSEELSRVRLV